MKENAKTSTNSDEKPNILLPLYAKNKNDKVKRKAVSALGEYLFYGAT